MGGPHQGTRGTRAAVRELRGVRVPGACVRACVSLCESTLRGSCVLCTCAGYVARVCATQ